MLNKNTEHKFRKKKKYGCDARNRLVKTSTKPQFEQYDFIYLFI